MKWVVSTMLVTSAGCSAFVHNMHNQNIISKSVNRVSLKLCRQDINNDDSQSENETLETRGQFLDSFKLSTSAAVMSVILGVSPNSCLADGGFKKTGENDGYLPDLPPSSVKSYLQYRFALQISADYYMYELQKMVNNIDDWGEVNQLFSVNQGRSGGQPSKVERDYVNPMRILALSMPPDIGDDLRSAQFKFEKAAQDLSKSTMGIRRDLPVAISSKDVDKAKKGWDEGRVALNEFFTVLNKSTGLNELKTIPPGPLGNDQILAYGRSQRKYFNLMKKTKLCQNRGGPVLSQAWGGLMISGYIQDSCGIPDMEEYFFQ